MVGVTRRLTLVMAVGCALSAANLYYAQPLLEAISRSFGAGPGGVSTVVTMSQIGYGLGLLALVPLGDLVDRRRMVCALLVVTAAALAGAAVAPSLAALDAAILIASLTSVVVQVLVPFAAALAAPAERGRVVGAVMSGLLMGILLARTLAGAVAALAGWRSVYVMAAVLMLGLAALLRRELPTPPRPAAAGYPALMRSVLEIARQEPIVRRRAFYGAAMFASFSVFWTSLAFLLTRPPYGYGEGVIGLFGLVGLAGAAMANVAGRAADAGRTRPATGLALAGLAASFALLALGSTSLAALIAGVVLLDAAVQAGQILNQSEIYRVRPDATSRVTTVYMAIYFAGGAVGSASAGALYATAGWGGVCALGAGLALAGLAAWVCEPRSHAARSDLPAADGWGTGSRSSGPADTSSPTSSALAR
ncbi:MAG: hypothetical protein QOK29_5089 [Rhodospirillaceae bacterium]|nr:hypothetical protein [Rhodospirillaceae bacterium]